VLVAGLVAAALWIVKNQAQESDDYSSEEKGGTTEGATTIDRGYEEESTEMVTDFKRR
jgi:hypothetical protein